jgi:hypothetical protein
MSTTPSDVAWTSGERSAISTVQRRAVTISTAQGMIGLIQIGRKQCPLEPSPASLTALDTVGALFDGCAERREAAWSGGSGERKGEGAVRCGAVARWLGEPVARCRKRESAPGLCARPGKLKLPKSRPQSRGDYLMGNDAAVWSDVVSQCVVGCGAIRIALLTTLAHVFSGRWADAPRCPQHSMSLGSLIGMGFGVDAPVPKPLPLPLGRGWTSMAMMRMGA